MSYYKEFDILWSNIMSQAANIPCKPYHCIAHGCREWHSCTIICEIRDEYKKELLKLQIKYL